MLNHKYISKRRTQLRLTMEDAAQGAGMGHRQTWYRLESGSRKTVSLGTLVAIARVLDCRLDDLVI